MNRVGLALTAWIFLGLDVAIARPVFELGHSGIAPNFLFVLVTFYAMVAPGKGPAWVAIVLGIAADLLTDLPLSTPAGRAIVVGPHALAYLVATQLVVSLRGIMIRRNPLTLGFLAACGGAVASVALVFIYWARSLLDPLTLSPTHDLVVGLASSLYTGVIAIPLALVLLPAAPLLGLPSQQQRRFAR